MNPTAALCSPLLCMVSPSILDICTWRAPTRMNALAFFSNHAPSIKSTDLMNFDGSVAHEQLSHRGVYFVWYSQLSFEEAVWHDVFVCNQVSVRILDRLAVFRHGHTDRLNRKWKYLRESYVFYTNPVYVHTKCSGTAPTLNLGTRRLLSLYNPTNSEWLLLLQQVFCECSDSCSCRFSFCPWTAAENAT